MVEAQLSEVGLQPIVIARELGQDVVFLTNRPERYAGLDAARLLEGDGCRMVVADTNDADKVHLAVLAVGAPVDAVYSMCDYNLPIAAEVAHRLNCPGLAPAAATTCRNKLRTRERLRETGLPVPRFANPRHLDELHEALTLVGLPCVVKPMTESASVDVRLCYTRDDAERQFAVITDRPLDARGQQRPPGVLVEEYLRGYEVSVETVRDGDRVLVLGVTDKQLGPAPVFAEIGDVFPSTLPEAITEACAKAALAGLDAVGHDFGCAHTEIRFVDGVPVIVEINGRLGGDDIPELIHLATGIDIYTESIRLHLGQTANFERTRRAAAASRAFSPASGGLVRSISGLDIVRAVKGVRSAELRIQCGDVLEAATSNHATFGHVLVTAATPSEAWRLADFATAQIAIDLDARTGPGTG
jgi:S-sulfo-L-cysteine synthase (3-phospho-L-serine-dependent)